MVGRTHSWILQGAALGHASHAGGSLLQTLAQDGPSQQGCSLATATPWRGQLSAQRWDGTPAATHTGRGAKCFPPALGSPG